MAIPVIDIGGLDSDDFSCRMQVARKIDAACRTTGFFAVVNHGVPGPVVDRAWGACRAYFDMPQCEKDKGRSDNKSVYPYGYERVESLDVSGGEDPKETYSLGPSDPLSDMPLRRPPPAAPAGFEEALGEYYTALEALSLRLLRGCAMALGLEAGWFDSSMGRHQCALRALNYFELSEGGGKLRAGPHTDYGALTILRSGGPGLQVWRGEGQGWVNAPDPPDGFIVNVGDLLQRWTNDRWTSTLHRVVAPREGRAERRQSLAFFVNVNGDAVVEPLKGCGPPKYGRTTAGEHLMQ
eukprot:Hpha_TRINITY_DN22426_c0_g1::TRINITY_DN22426_c0_g1_i1::g.95052::m.95052